MLHILTDAAGAPAGSNWSMIIMLVLLFAVMYFIMIRPENKKRKEAEAMRSALSVGDKITTIGGITGTIVNIKDDNIVIETGADRVRVEFVKWAVSTNNSREEKKAAEAKAARDARKAKKAGK